MRTVSNSWNSFSECFNNCPNTYPTPGHLPVPPDFLTDRKMKFNELPAISVVNVTEGTLSDGGNTLTLSDDLSFNDPGEYRFPSIVIIPENTVLRIDGPAIVKNTEFQVYGMLNIGSSGDKEQVFLENVTIRGMKTDPTKYSYGHLITLTSVYMKGGAFYPYERFRFQDGRVEVYNTTFEGLELPINNHGNLLTLRLWASNFLRTPPLIFGSWYYDSSDEFSSNHLSEFKLGAQIIYPKLPPKRTYESSFYNSIQRNNFFTDNASKVVRFTDNFPSNAQGEIYKKCYWHNSATGRGLSADGVHTLKTQGASSPVPLTMEENRDRSVIMGEETESNRTQYKFKSWSY